MTAARRHAVAADCVFDGEAVRRHAAVLFEGGEIVALVPRAELPDDVPLRHLPDGAWLAPGFIDLQVNGGADVLFNDAPTVASIRAIAAAHRRLGTTALLPTLISDRPKTMAIALAAAEAAAQEDPGVLGIHLEGPFLSPVRAGVHATRFIRTPAAEDLELLKAPRRCALVVTLAPERVPRTFVRELAGAGVRVCLGHSDATYVEAQQAVEDGVRGFTHLFNAMRPMASREPGPIPAALERANVWFGMIADGIHVHPAMVRMALAGAAKPMLVSDAMPPVGGRAAGFNLYDEAIAVHDGRCTRADGTLAGAILDMATAVRNCVRLAGTSLETALRYATLHPATFLGLEERLGRLAPRCRADMVAIDPRTLAVLQTWVGGEPVARDR